MAQEYASPIRLYKDQADAAKSFIERNAHLGVSGLPDLVRRALAEYMARHDADSNAIAARRREIDEL